MSGLDSLFPYHNHSKGFTMTKDLFSQEKYIVAFIDVLGTQEKIKKHPTEAIQDMWIYCHSILKELHLNGNENLKIKIFSDNILICERIDENNAKEAINDILTSLTIITTTMINSGIVAFVRGAVVIGDLHFEDNFVLGKALVDAYDLESKHANFPRILFDDSFIEALTMITPFKHKDKLYSNLYQLTKELNAPFEIEKNDEFYRTICTVYPFVKQDSDGKLFFNFLETSGYITSREMANYQQKRLNFKSFKQAILLNVEENKTCQKIIQKMVWLAYYYNDFCIEHDLDFGFSQQELQYIENFLNEQK